MSDLFSILPALKVSSQHVRFKTKADNEVSHNLNEEKLKEISKFSSSIYQTQSVVKRTKIEFEAPCKSIESETIQTSVSRLCAYSDDSEEEDERDNNQIDSKNYLISSDTDDLPPNIGVNHINETTKIQDKSQKSIKIDRNHPRYQQPNVFDYKFQSNDDYHNYKVTDHHISRIEPDLNEIIKRENHKRKRGNAIGVIDNTNIIDFNVNKIIEQNKEDLLKNMTKEEIKPAQTFKGGKFGAQITYLAQLAKERDHELKAAWAEQKNTRRVSKQRYGF